MLAKDSSRILAAENGTYVFSFNAASVFTTIDIALKMYRNNNAYWIAVDNKLEELACHSPSSASRTLIIDLIKNDSVAIENYSAAGVPVHYSLLSFKGFLYRPALEHRVVWALYTYDVHKLVRTVNKCPAVNFEAKNTVVCFQYDGRISAADQLFNTGMWISGGNETYVTAPDDGLYYVILSAVFRMMYDTSQPCTILLICNTTTLVTIDQPRNDYALGASALFVTQRSLLVQLKQGDYLAVRMTAYTWQHKVGFLGYRIY